MTSTPTGRRIGIVLAVIFCVIAAGNAVFPVSRRSEGVALIWLILGAAFGLSLIRVSRMGRPVTHSWQLMLPFVISGVIVGSGGIIFKLIGADAPRILGALVCGMLLALLIWARHRRAISDL
jgi:hypothetical protein